MPRSDSRALAHGLIIPQQFLRLAVENGEHRVPASKDSTRPEWSRSCESGRPVESDPRIGGSGPMSGLVFDLRVGEGSVW